MIRYNQWYKIAIINLSIVVFLGCVLRYKIAFSLPWIDQKNLLQSHSHFAFAGWISQLLMTLIVSYLDRHGVAAVGKRYRPVLWLNLITAFGMLLSFPFEGYGPVSIVFSTLSIFVSYAFAILVWKDMEVVAAQEVSQAWIKAAVIFNAVSSIGAFSLAYMLASGFAPPRLYLSAIYFFLHFQYNGWFLFACFGLLFDWLSTYGIIHFYSRTVFRLFLFACVPAYMLSVLWLSFPSWMFVFIVPATIAQLIGWALVIKILYSDRQKLKVVNVFSGWILKLSAIAFTIKMLLQTGSTHPDLSKLAFGYRPIVIGYLHLVLLAVITLFLIGYLLVNKTINVNRTTRTGLVIFVSGIIINEVLLMLQGIRGMQGEMLPGGNELLFAVALIMLTGMTIFNKSQFISHKAEVKSQKQLTN